MKTISLLLLGALFSTSLFAQTSLQGSVTDAETGEPVIFGTVALYQNGVLKGGTETDFDGFYTFSSLPAGEYDVVFSYTGYADYKVVGVVVQSGKSNQLKAWLSARAATYCGFTCGASSPLIRIDDTTQGFKFNANEIRRTAF